jgi:hypothetical protein
MNSKAGELVAERFRLTLDIFEFGERLLRQKLRRKHPQATEAELEAGIVEWLQRRPGAEQGDGEGRPVSWPRRK